MKLHKIAVLVLLMAASVSGFANEGGQNAAEIAQENVIVKFGK